MSDAQPTAEQSAREEANALARSLALVVTAIEKAQEVGCVDHLDCWDESEEEFYKPIRDAKELLERLQYD